MKKQIAALILIALAIIEVLIFSYNLRCEDKPDKQSN